MAWGSNGWGQCNIPSPNTGFIAISAGDNHSLGLKEDRSVVAWGQNGTGQCNIPSPNSDFIAIAAGGYHNLAIKYLCQYDLAGDLDDDCKVRFHDFAKMAAEWLADFSDLQEMAANWLIDCDKGPNNPACIPK